MQMKSEIFNEELEILANKYETHLAQYLSKGTVSKHISIVFDWIHYYTIEKGNDSFKSLSVSVVNSGFRQWRDSALAELDSVAFTKTALTRFLNYLIDIHNQDIPEKVMKKISIEIFVYSYLNS